MTKFRSEPTWSGGDGLVPGSDVHRLFGRLVTFIVHGPPVPKGRPRTFTRGKVTRTITPQRTRDYESMVAEHALSALRVQHGGSWPMDARMHVMVDAYMPTRRLVDVDNLAKAALDAMNGVVYDDDSQVSRLTIERHYDPTNPRIRVAVEVLEPASA